MSRRTRSQGPEPQPRHDNDAAAHPQPSDVEPPESSTGLAVHRVGGWRQLPNAQPEQVMAWRIKLPDDAGDLGPADPDPTATK